MAKNYYEILGVSPRASQVEVEAAYRRLAEELHPDRYPDRKERYLTIQQAYSVLCDPKRRSAYDRELSRESASVERKVINVWPEQPGPISEPGPPAPAREPDDLGVISLIRSFQTHFPTFDEIFDWLWSNFKDVVYSKSGKVKDLTVDVEITPDEAQQGGSARVLVPARADCPACRGGGGIGPYECWRCDGDGWIAGEFPITVAYPPGLISDYTVLVPLHQYGIRNLYLTVTFRIVNDDM